MVQEISKKMKRLEQIRLQMGECHENIKNAKNKKEASKFEKKMISLVNKSVEVINGN